MRRLSALVLSLGALTAWAGTAAGEAPWPKFREVVVDPEIGKVCYAVALADVDGDGRTDIVAVTENRVIWYQNPTWKKHVILEDQTERDNVCIAAHDIDGDGRIDFALGAGWTKVGTIQWISRPDSGAGLWRVHAIGVEPWTHRMQFADVLGCGTPQLVVSPLNRTTGEGVRLTAFRIPADPRRDRWPATVLDDSLNRMHNHLHTDLDGNGCVDTITASQEGISWIRRTPAGFEQTRIGSGMPGGTPETSGAGEVRLGRLASGRRFLATVEPMHGTSVVVYLEPPEPHQLWERRVLDDSLRQGHAVWPADLTGDGSDEIIAGHREAGEGPVRGPGVFLYRVRAADGTAWEKHVLDDGGVAVEDLAAGDLTGDGRIDIVAGGRATHNLKLYINLGTGADAAQ